MLEVAPTLDNFMVGENAELVARLTERGGGFVATWLRGAPGSGRSHLLAGFVAHHHPSARLLAADLATPGNLTEATAAVANGRLANLAIDDVDQLAGDRDREQALLHLFNQLTQTGATAPAGTRLLLSGAASPLDTPFGLPDLASRLRAAACLRVAEISDADKSSVLREAADAKGIRLPPAVASFWLDRASRDLPSLMRDLEQLDHAALADQRRALTIPFVKQVLQL